MEDLIGRAASVLAQSRYAIALTGAGISTESGIRDFRGPDGVWTRDPAAERRAYQTYHRFLANPKRFWEESLDRPGLLGDLTKVQPNPGHYALADLENLGILKWVITQNIDNLHRQAGSRHVLEYHGNTTLLRCIACNTRFAKDDFDLPQMKAEGKLPPTCAECGEVLKSDVVHFNEPIPSDVAEQSQAEAERCDVMLICGTSATVYPFALLPRTARRRRGVTIIEINGEPTPLTQEKVSDYLIQGKTGEILPRIVQAVRRLQSDPTHQ